MLLKKGLITKNIYEGDFNYQQKLEDFDECFATRKTSVGSPITNKEKHHSHQKYDPNIVFNENYPTYPNNYEAVQNFNNQPHEFTGPTLTGSPTGN